MVARGTKDIMANLSDVTIVNEKGQYLVRILNFANVSFLSLNRMQDLKYKFRLQESMRKVNQSTILGKSRVVIALSMSFW